jgi:hypothetical protein
MTLNDPITLAEVTSAFDRYEKALVSNDIAVLDTLFWEDPKVVRYGAKENLYGYEEIAAFRKARPSKGLKRTLTRTVNTYATAWTEFSRPGSKQIGRQSQVWVKRAEGWRIVAAHVSNME